MSFAVTKTYDHSVGISAAFRQWRATHSHCRFLHGYALAFEFKFSSQTLDHRNWVQDFGDLDDLKRALMENFDHKTVVAKDDPALEKFREMAALGMLELVELDAVGCERFAQYAAEAALAILKIKDPEGRVKLEYCTVREHGANSATYYPE